MSFSIKSSHRFVKPKFEPIPASKPISRDTILNKMSSLSLQNKPTPPVDQSRRTGNNSSLRIAHSDMATEDFY